MGNYTRAIILIAVSALSSLQHFDTVGFYRHPACITACTNYPHWLSVEGLGPAWSNSKESGLHKNL